MRHSRKNSFVPNWAKQGRTYADYLDYTEQHPDIAVTQLDTVIGRIGGKVVMTIHFVSCNFMVGLLLENKTAAEAADKIQHLKYVMEEHGFAFGNVIPFLLTDNGGEFSALSAFENDAKGNLETRMFFASLGGSIRKTSYRKEPYAL